jgi:hypothetical protein
LTCSWQEGAEKACNDAIQAGPGSSPDTLLRVAQVHALIAIGRRLGEVERRLASIGQLIEISEEVPMSEARD